MVDSEEIKLIWKLKLGVVPPNCNSSTEEAEVGELLQIQSQLGTQQNSVLTKKRQWNKNFLYKKRKFHSGNLKYFGEIWDIISVLTKFMKIDLKTLIGNISL